MTALYEAFAAGQSSPLAELPIQYADFAFWERCWMDSEAQQQQLAYWKKQLGPVPPALELPFDRERLPVMNFHGESIQVSLPPELTTQLLTLSRREGVTLYMTLLAAFKTLLHRYSSQTDIIVGADVANRHHVETEKLIGFFVNMLVLRTDLSGDPTFRELLQRVKEVALGAYAHQHTPFATLVNELNVKREWNRNPLFQVVFVLQNAPLQDFQLRGLTLSQVNLKSNISPFDMVVSLTEIRGGLEGFLLYSSELFECATMERLLAHYRNLLESIVADPDELLSGMRLFGPEEAVDYSAPGFMAELGPRELENMLMEINEIAAGD
jgi:non-ribosomal peptide synthetase component F